MASLANTALLYNLGLEGFANDDNRTASGNNTQTGASPINGQLTRCLIAGATTNSFILKSVLTGDGWPLVFVVNDSPVALNIFPAVGDFNNGVLNQALSVPAGQSGIFVRVPNHIASQQSSTPGWRSVAIP
jgi:hypothetical protein